MDKIHIYRNAQLVGTFMLQGLVKNFEYFSTLQLVEVSPCFPTTPSCTKNEFFIPVTCSYTNR